MAGGLRYETGRDMPPGMAEKVAVQIARQMEAAAPTEAPEAIPVADCEVENKRWLIDATPLMKNGWHLVRTGESNKFLASMSFADVPTVDAMEVVHGRWIPLEYDGYADGNPVWDLWECSECREEHSGDEDTLTPYCPYCGAKMDGGNDDVLL